MLLRLVWVTRVYLLEEHPVSIHIKPDTRRALRRRFVLPAVIAFPGALDRGEIALKSVVGGCCGQRCSRQKIPRLCYRVANRRNKIPPSFSSVVGSEADLILSLLQGV